MNERTPTREEIAEELNIINSWISAQWIGLKKMPTEKEVIEVNRWIGEIIKKIRKGAEV